tara:strand:- start:3354 stop:5207 length:1854 start_codon:yes stop_codon:yes gene_type:complete
MPDKIFLIENLNLLSKFRLYLNSKKNKDMQCIFVNYQLTDYSNKKEVSNYLKNIKISKYENETITFKANRIALDFLREMDLKNSFFEFVKQRVNNEKIIYAAKKSVLSDLEKKTRFYTLYKFLKKKYPNKQIIRYEYLIDFCEVAKKMKVRKDSDIFPKINNVINSVIYSILYMPFWFIRLVLRNGFHLYKNPETLGITQHLANGFDFGSDKKFKQSRLDNLLYENLDSKHKSSFAFIFSNWEFGRDQTSKMMNYLNKRKIKYIFEFQNSINLKYFINHILSDYLYIILINLRTLFRDINNSYYCLPALRLIRNIHETEIFLQHYRPKVFFGRDDYNTSHIVKTIILNKYNCKHVGFHHSAFLYPHISTLLTYTYFNYYFLAGKKYHNELYNDYWFSENYKTVGQPYIDYIFKAKLNTTIQNKLKNKFQGKTNILFAIPTINGTSNFDSIDNIREKYSGIINKFKKYKNVNLIFRCRTFEDSNNLKTIISFKPDFHKNIYFINNEFNTYELISFADIIIGSDTSSLLIESIALKNKLVVPYNVRFKSKSSLIWHKYKYPLLCNNLNDLNEIIMKHLSGKISKSYKKIAKDIANGYSSPSDGKTWKRIADSVIGYANS